MKRSNAVYTIAPRHTGDIGAQARARAYFLKLIGSDSRTRNLFAYWGHMTGVDAIVEKMVGLLDAATRRAGLPHRSHLGEPEYKHHLIPILGFLQQHEAEYERRLDETGSDRARFAIGFVVAELYGTTKDEDVPVREWLANDLMTMFRAEVGAHVWGTTVALTVPVSPTLTVVPRGRERKHGGAHLERWVGWYYRTTVAVSKATAEDLAREYRAARAAEGVFLAPKDAAGITERPDTKAVRNGIKEAKRLVELPIPPEQWDAYLTKIGLITGGK